MDMYFGVAPKINLTPTTKKKAENMHNGAPKKIKNRFPTNNILLIMRFSLQASLDTGINSFIFIPFWKNTNKTKVDRIDKNIPRHTFNKKPLQLPYENLFQNCNTIRLRYFEENYERN